MKKNILMLLVSGVFLLAGCTTTKPVAEKVDLPIPELGIVVTVNADWTYKMVGTDRADLITLAGSKVLSIETFGPPEIPASVTADTDGFAAAIEKNIPNFALVSKETFPNGFLINFTIAGDESFSSVIKVDDTPFLCEPQSDAFIPDFPQYKDICKSIK